MHILEKIIFRAYIVDGFWRHGIPKTIKVLTRRPSIRKGVPYVARALPLQVSLFRMCFVECAS